MGPPQGPSAQAHAKTALPAKNKFYRRSPNLVFYWSGRKLVFENYYRRTKVQAAPLLFELLNFFDTWRSSRSFENHYPDIDSRVLRAGLSVLVRHGLLEYAGARRKGSFPETMASWEKWNPAAGFLHFSTKDGPYRSDLDLLLRRQQTRARNLPMPSPVKCYPRTKQVMLPEIQRSSEFPQVLLARRTWRRFSPRPVELATLSTLLGLSFGVQWWVQLRNVGRVGLKTSPSGGARHPIEVYLLARRVDGLRSGLYHYRADKHYLELLKRGASSNQFERYLAGQKWCRGAAALVLMTAVFKRPQWKYESPRAYRSVLIDAGHLCQTFCLVATWLGLAPFCTMALADSLIEAEIGIDGVLESVLYAAGIGTPPNGLEWAPWPPHFQGGTRRPNLSFWRE